MKSRSVPTHRGHLFSFPTVFLRLPHFSLPPKNLENSKKNKNQQRPRDHPPARRPGQRRQRCSRSHSRSRSRSRPSSRSRSRYRRSCSWNGQRRPQARARGRPPLPRARRRRRRSRGLRRRRRSRGGLRRRRRDPLRLRLRRRHLPRRLAPRRLLPRGHEPQAARDRRVRRGEQHLLQHFHVSMRREREKERRVFFPALEVRYFLFLAHFLFPPFPTSPTDPHPKINNSGTPPATATWPSSGSRSTSGSPAGSTPSPLKSRRRIACRSGSRTPSTRRAPSGACRGRRWFLRRR